MIKRGLFFLMLSFCAEALVIAAVDEGSLTFQDGSILRISQNEIVLLRQSDDDISMESFTFKIASEVTLEFLKSLSDLSVGDEVVIGFSTEKKDRIAQSVLLSEKSQDL